MIVSIIIILNVRINLGDSVYLKRNLNGAPGTTSWIKGNQKLCTRDTEISERGSRCRCCFENTLAGERDDDEDEKL